MENITVTSVSVNDDVLANHRNAVAAEHGEVKVRLYGVERAYASCLNTHLAAEWYEVEHSMTGETAKPVHVEKKALYAVLKAAGHSNPSVVWARVREYGREEIHGKVEKVEGESEGAGDRNRSPVLRNLEELLALYKFNDRLDVTPAKVVEAQKHIVLALTALDRKFM